ncbi:hypothetical protein PPTG_20852 [Phytophthora nicotianae INRA-310]|uniref:HTH CENPB-type domain-containing protein n=1 Tax=Phytophthora nicotianae (strain INRA-310) TaxID=761204 RepID=W2RIB4_PHYN3|nr:hypothetical protein PPTG_20852 [Phytophthora nicotianae INRA-310]ETN24966.1 hypothetical protein PPTG_20852 [Phytophthora nicotianae INRA-310]
MAVTFCHPWHLATPSLADKQTICGKAAAEPWWTVTELAKWATQKFQVPVKRTTLHGSLKRKRDYTFIPGTHSLRKRLCSSSQQSVDELLIQKIQAYKAWHENATITGATVISIALREGVQLPSGMKPSRGWLYPFKQRTGL